jgi:hypothetical protein
MGLSIHYSATLKKVADLSALISQMTEVANALNWQSTIVINPDVSGIVVSPPNCEPLLLCFAPDGETCGIEFLKDSSPSGHYYNTIHLKTAYAGPEIHKALIDILGYLSRKYLHKIQVYDEGEYWETGDLKRLSSHFGGDNKVVDNLGYPTDLALSPGEFGWITQTLSKILGTWLKN